MSVARQKRQSCEQCRARKLKCSGEKTGCSRCLSWSLPCKFQDKGAPGRPRKRLQPEPTYRNERDERLQEVTTRPPDCDQEPTTGPLQQEKGSGDILTSEGSNSPQCHVSQLSPAFRPGLSDPCGLDSLLMANGDCWTNQLDVFGHETGLTLFPPDFFGPYGPAPLANRPQEVNSSDVSLSPEALSPSCDCAQDVFESTRALRRETVSHDTVRRLRLGVELAGRLLNCPFCYDLSKPPKVTIQNVLLLGRLMFEITSGYQRYLRWLRESHGTESTDGSKIETVYLIPGLEFSPVLGFKVSSSKFRDLVLHGLQTDVEQLSAVGAQFALRQHNRHIVGHEACSDPQGRCWREESGVDMDPLDVCPQSPAAKSLVPCYRIVEDVQAKIKEIMDSLK